MTGEQWLAIRNKDASYDGIFYFGRKSQKTVCRPSCPIRVNSPRNLAVFDSLEEAANQGYKLCPRCTPEKKTCTSPRQALADAAEELIRQNYTRKFSLEQISGELHIDKFYLARTFKEQKGMTLLEYHNSVRCEEAEKLLRSPELSMTFISCMTGFATASHFSRIFKKMRGCTPTEYRGKYLKELEEKRDQRSVSSDPDS